MLRKETFVHGEYYHLYNRGIDKRSLIKSPHDYRRFMLLLYVANSREPIRLDNLISILHKSYEEIFSVDRTDPLVSIGAWCIMTNHFHLLIREKSEGGISAFMKKLGTAYSMYFNIKYQRTGGLFGGPFKSKHISSDEHLRHLFGYIHLNPLDIQFSGWESEVKKHPEVWKNFLGSYSYSSFQDYAGVLRPETAILERDAFPQYFSIQNTFEDFIESYLSFDPILKTKA